MASANQKKTIPALVLMTGLATAPGVGAAPSIDSAGICTDGTEFRYSVDITETGPADPIRIRIDAESDPFVPPALQRQVEGQAGSQVPVANLELSVQHDHRNHGIRRRQP